MWNPLDHSDQDNLKWCRLRALEWGALPGYLSQAVGPVLLLEWPLWKVLLGVLVADALWAIVRYRFVSVGASYLSWAFVSWVRLPVTFLVAVYFACRHDGVNASLCLGWFFASGAIEVFPVKADRIQKMLMAKLGYERPDGREGMATIDDVITHLNRGRGSKPAAGL